MAGTISWKETQSSGSAQDKTLTIGASGLSLAQPLPTSASASYVTITELGTGQDHLTKVVVSGLPITLGNTTGVSFGSVGLITFPKALIHIPSVSVVSFLFDYTDDAGNVTPLTGTMGGDFSLGSTATSDATLDGTDVNILASTSYDPFSTAVTANSAINAVLDGTTTAITCYINALVDDGDVSDGASDIVEISGTFYFKWYVIR